MASHAFLDLGLDDLADVVAYDAVARQASDGRLAEIDGDGLVNSASVGEVVRRASCRHDDDALAEAFDRQVAWICSGAPRAADGTVFHLAGMREVWVDTVYMVVPLLVLAGRVDEARRQLDGHERRLRDPATGLYAHRWDEDSRTLSRAARWGTGNGWVAAGLARALHLLAEEGIDDGGFARRAREQARELVDACLEHRRPDGLFHDVLDDPTSFTETNVAQMLAYTVLTGVADGWLPAGYADVGTSLLDTARAQVGPLGFVEGVCGAPRFDRPGPIRGGPVVPPSGPRSGTAPGRRLSPPSCRGHDEGPRSAGSGAFVVAVSTSVRRGT
ncbi:glycoside hydrolase family 88 protein [Cellulomonas sp. PhB143]|uniref:glycoside hydrolase family 88 protein n=1 Tax=Cellulomonas sp. PhB143 TaxID=2485186 RepID=UPI0018F60790|nr:glycoside hydrolase family 88 protein [Cellulomonas sp. PhB143]